MSASTGKLKLRLRVFNVILIALSALSICWLAIFPFLKVEVHYNLTEETVEELMKDMDEENVDVKDIVGDGIDLGVSVAITPKMLIKSVTTSDTGKFVKEDVIAPTVQGIIDDLLPVIKEIAKRAVKSTAKKELTTKLQSSFKEAFGEDVDVVAKLGEAGIDLDKELDEVFDMFLEGEPTIDSVSESIATKFTSLAGQVADKFEEYNAGDIPSITAAEIKEAIEGPLKEIGLADESGKILDFEAMLSLLLDKATGENNDTSGEGSLVGLMSVDPLNRVYADEEMTAEEQAEAAEETETLADKVRDLIYDKLPEGVEDNIGMILKIVAGVLGLFILTWAFVGVFALLKTIFGRNPGIFTGLICFISGLVQIIIGVVLVFGIKIVQNGVSIDVIQSAMKSIPSGLSVALISSTTITGFCVLAKWILAPFYHSNKRRLKKRLDLE